ncbi:hypothetical protein D9M72_580000 [compost metagenome]
MNTGCTVEAMAACFAGSGLKGIALLIVGNGRQSAKGQLALRLGCEMHEQLRQTQHLGERFGPHARGDILATGHEAQHALTGGN